MRKLIAIGAALTLAVPAAAQQHQHHQQQADSAAHEAHDGHPMEMHYGDLPEGWEVRTDRDAPIDEIHFMAMGDRFHAITGPAGVFYNPDWRRDGDYEVSARLVQRKSPEHPEAYGIVIGGKNLDNDQQAYTYLLVRKTGEYFIATRRGDERIKVADWTAHDAVNAETEDGRQENVLGARVAGDHVAFIANGTEVARFPRSELETNGIFGFRVNHRLDVVIDEVR